MSRVKGRGNALTELRRCSMIIPLASGLQEKKDDLVADAEADAYDIVPVWRGVGVTVTSSWTRGEVEGEGEGCPTPPLLPPPPPVPVPVPQDMPIV